MEALALNHFDYIVLTVILIGGFSSLFKGFVTDFLSLMLWVAAVYASISFSYFAFPIVAQYFQNETTITIVSYLALFVVTIIIGSLVLKVIAKLINWIGLGPIDKVLGFMFGALKGFIFLCAIYLALPEQTRQMPFIKESRTEEYIKIGSSKLQTVVDKFVLIYSEFRTDKSQTS
ncbi:MAG: Colicin production protein [Pseudomonadota bacterium]